MASFNYFLGIDGVEGGSQAEHHVGDFVALGFEFDLDAAVAASSGSGAGTGKPIFEPLIVDLAVTPGLVDLLSKEASGLHIPTVTFTIQKPGASPFDFATITLTNATIISYEETAGFAPRVAIAYDKIQIEQIEQSATGGPGETHTFSFDLAAQGGSIASPSAEELAPQIATSGTFNYFLDIPGIAGGSHALNHENAFEALGYEFDLAHAIATTAGGGAGAGKTTFEPLIVDLATTPGLVDLLTKEASGQHIPNLTFTIQKAGGTPFDFATITLTNAAVVSYQEATGFATRVAIAYSKIEIQQVEQSATGGPGETHTFSFDLAAQGGAIDSPPANDLTPKVPAETTFNYFLDIPGVTGGSQDAHHPGDFVALGYEFDLASAFGTIGGGGGIGKPTFEPLIVDLASTPGLVDLLTKEASGVHIPTVTFAVQKPGASPMDFMTIKLNDAVITSYQESSGLATRVAIAYDEIEIKQVEQSPTGGPGTIHTFHFDLATQGGSIAAPSAEELAPKTPTGTAFNYFLDIPGLTGGSHADNHEGEFQALGYEFDFAAAIGTIGGGGGGAGKAVLEPLIVDLAAAPGLVDLLSKEASGQHIPTVTFTVQKPGASPFDFMTITLSDATITSYQESAGFAPRVAIAYEKIEIEQVEQSPTGGPGQKHTFSFDLAAQGGTIDSPAANELTPAVPTATTFNYFLDIPGLTGGSHDAHHVGEFQALGYEFDLAHAISTIGGGGGSAGKAAFEPLIVDLAATPGLVDLLGKEAAGQHIPTVTFTVQKPGASPFDFMTITLSDAVITSYQETTDFATRVAIAYNKIEIEQVEQTATGGPGETHTFRFDLASQGGSLTSPSADELAPQVTADTSFNYFLDIPGLTGGSQDAHHVGEFQALGYEFDLANAISAIGGGGGAGKATFEPLIIDLAATPGLVDLLTKEAAGQHIPTVTFTVQKPGAHPLDFMTITIKDVIITSYQETGGGAVQIALDYNQIQIAETEQKADGSPGETHTFGWDLVNNQPITEHVPVIDAIAPEVVHEVAFATGSDQPDTAAFHATFTDPDLSDTGFTAAVTGVVAAGTTAGLALDNASLLGLLTSVGVHKDAGVATGTADFAFSAPDKTFDYLGEGQELTLTYTVAVDDHHGGIGTQTATVEIQGSNDAPVFTSPATFTMAENNTASGVVAAVDPELSNLTYSLFGGADQSFFAIDSQTGALRFLASPDFETPEDANGDNVYQLTVAATDALGATRTQNLSIDVTDVFEPGKVINGSNGGDVLRGGTGDDVIDAGNGGDNVDAGDGNDTVLGGNGDDTLMGGRGADLLNGENGDDFLVGDKGNDVLNGENGNDTEWGGLGDDVLSGGNGNDVLAAGDGKDVLMGENGNDDLDGGLGDDRLLGGDGRDVLQGGSGNDLLFGGKGPDTFEFGPGFGKDVVADFAKEDTVAFQDSVFHSVQDILAASHQVGSDTVITVDAQDTVTLANVSVQQLHANNFTILH
jgi:VCBS repeat-containing protein